MGNRLTTRLLRRAARLAAQSAIIQGELTDAFRERYGVTYSDVDCDRLIDILDYHGGDDLTVRDCDEAMAACGVFPLANPDHPVSQIGREK